MSAYPKVWRGAHADMLTGARSTDVPEAGDLVLTDEGGHAVGDGVTPLRGLAFLARTVTLDFREYITETSLNSSGTTDRTALAQQWANDCAADGKQPLIPRTKYGIPISGRVAFSRFALPVGGGWLNQALGATPGPGSGFTTLADTAGVDIGALTGSGVQGGTWGGFFVNGNGIAKQPLHVGLLSFARGHGTVRVTGTVGHATDPTQSHGRAFCAMLVDRLQNGELPQIQLDNLGGSALILDWGCGGFIVPALEIAKIQGWQIELLDSNPGSADSIYPTGPSNINFLKGVIERAGGDSGNFLGGVNMESGQDVYFHPGLAFALPSGLNVETAIFKLRKTGTAAPQLTDLGVIVSGDKSATVIYDVGDGCRVTRPNTLAGHHKAAKWLYKLAATATVTTDGGDTLSPNVRGLLHPSSAGTLAGNVFTTLRTDNFAVRPSSASAIVFSTRQDAVRILCSSTTAAGVTTMHRAVGETNAFTAAMVGASIQVASDSGDDIFKTTVATFVDADTVTLTAPLTVDVASAVVKVSEKADRLTIDGTGKHVLGDGSGPGDTNWYRGGADLLQTDDDWKARRLLRSVTTVTLSANNSRTFDAGVADRYLLNLNSFNCTSLTISNHSDGQVIRVKITQGATVKSVTWAAGPVWGWAGAPQVPQVANASMIVTFVSDGTNLYQAGPVQWLGVPFGAAEGVSVIGQTNVSGVTASITSLGVGNLYQPAQLAVGWKLHLEAYGSIVAPTGGASSSIALRITHGSNPASGATLLAAPTLIVAAQTGAVDKQFAVYADLIVEATGSGGSVSCYGTVSAVTTTAGAQNTIPFATTGFTTTPFQGAVAVDLSAGIQPGLSVAALATGHTLRLTRAAFTPPERIAV